MKDNGQKAQSLTISGLLFFFLPLLNAGMQGLPAFCLLANGLTPHTGDYILSTHSLPAMLCCWLTLRSSCVTSCASQCGQSAHCKPIVSFANAGSSLTLPLLLLPAHILVNTHSQRLQERRKQIPPSLPIHGIHMPWWALTLVPMMRVSPPLKR